MTEENLVVLTTVPGRINAEAILSYLQAFDVQGMISMEAIGSVFPLTVGKLGSVQILVREENMEKASQLLQEFYSENSIGEELTDDELPVDLEEYDV